jgi:hypothetical protein
VGIFGSFFFFPPPPSFFIPNSAHRLTTCEISLAKMGEQCMTGYEGAGSKKHEIDLGFLEDMGPNELLEV